MCDLETREIFISRDVVFEESKFPFERAMGQECSTIGQDHYQESLKFLDDFGLGHNSLKEDLDRGHLGITASPT